MHGGEPVINWPVNAGLNCLTQEELKNGPKVLLVVPVNIPHVGHFMNGHKYY